MKINKILMIVTMLIMLVLTVSAQEYVDSYTIFEGTYSSGDVDSLMSVDNDIFIIEEITTPLGMAAEFYFNDIATFASVNSDFKYTGVGTSHIMELEIYDFDEMDWILLQEFSLGDEFNMNYPLLQTSRFIDANNTVKVRFHHPQIGSTNHELYIDRLVLLPADEQIFGEACPTSSSDSFKLLIPLIIVGVLLLISFATRQPLIGVFAGIGLLFFSFALYGCFLISGMITTATGVILMLYFVFVEL